MYWVEALDHGGARLSSAQDGKKERATEPLRHVFGPVGSGRLGVSLGLDLLGSRICSFDCLYCEAGVTEALTTARKPYVPARRLLDELAAWKAAGHAPPDVVTLGGLGEPCLNSELGAVIVGAKELFPDLPVAVLTNSSLMADPGVRLELAQADIVLPSMDTLVPAEYHRLNRPHAAVGLTAIRQGLLDFRAAYDGKIFLEVLLLAGINDSAENGDLLQGFCRELAPNRVDVVTLSRPGAHPGCQAASAEALARFRSALGGAVQDAGAPRRAEGHGPAALAGPALEALAGRIAASVDRRPQTEAGLAAGLGVPAAQVRLALAALVRAKAVRERREGDAVFYSGLAG
ncbi:MAG: Fe-S oxidoreductase [Solidesulfovibrio magneticus str. Maddingley MBC34]|uniref:Fe-S oxidoreductase n=1 Tax=Solidesulfovibrio magneticus str. Maddingley MBC34 TaxID=1206767 RepID=K6GNQ8_9BACT|nr:MAG: Fe-S oxidoreductase [Solidesulfovibrio magneticus str. Maddingley MBC34]